MKTIKFIDFTQAFLLFWRKPHPFVFNWVSVFIPFVITFAVIFVFQPYSFAHFELSDLLLWSTVFSIIPAACVFLVVKGLQLFAPRLFNEENWTLGKEALLVLFVILVIATALYLLFLVIDGSEVNDLFHQVLLRTVVLSIFPVLVLVLYEQYSYQKKQWRSAARINEKLLLQQKEYQALVAKQDEKVKLVGENQKMALQLDPSQIVYIRSEGNYVDIYHLDNNTLQKTLVRNSLKAIEAQLPSIAFFRSHRSYLVAIAHIRKVEGNARNLMLYMDKSSEPLPVSRSNSKELKELLRATKS